MQVWKRCDDIWMCLVLKLRRRSRVLESGASRVEKVRVADKCSPMWRLIIDADYSGKRAKKG
jgi:hypothetical protein